METRYYYLRLPEDKPNSWIPCSKARAEKRQKAAWGQEAFSSLVVSLTETEETEAQKGFVSIREIETEGYETAVSITLTKNLIFGGEDKEYRARIALDIYESAADCALNWALRQ